MNTNCSTSSSGINIVEPYRSLRWPLVLMVIWIIGWSIVGTTYGYELINGPSYTTQWLSVSFILGYCALHFLTFWMGFALSLIVGFYVVPFALWLEDTIDDAFETGLGQLVIVAVFGIVGMYWFPSILQCQRWWSTILAIIGGCFVGIIIGLIVLCAYVWFSSHYEASEL